MATRYDVALSFAGEDRVYAEELAKELAARGISAYFHLYQEEEAWGKDLYAYLTELYRDSAQYVVMFVSRHYPIKQWTGVEQRAAEARVARESREYMLPLRMDDTSLGGPLSTTAYVDWFAKGAGGVADLILKKLGRLINEVDKAELLLVPAGEFSMGSNYEPKDRMPQRRVWLDRFYVYKHPVTYGQYISFCEATGREPDATSVMEDLRPEADHPLVGASWFEARAYCEWARVSLPTEAQWEKAARGPDGRRFPWGNAWEDGRCQFRRLRWGYAGIASRVGSFPGGTSPYGAQDMCGNIWEWCADWYDADYYSRAPVRNPTGPSTGARRVKRGCGWQDDIMWFPVNFESSFRHHEEPHFRYRLDGFRCVLNPAPVNDGGELLPVDASD